jgi:general secretion pathway protein G
MQRSRKNRPARGGFTLLEILIVLAIIGVIAAMVVPQLIGQQKLANIKVTRGSISGLEQSMKMYAVEHSGTYPTGSQEAIAVLTQPSVDATTGRQTEALLKAVPMDAWQRPLYYEYPNTKSNVDEPAIWSSGPDGKNDNGSGDDINNWTSTPAATASR